MAATIYSVWRGRFIANTIDAALAPYHLPAPATDHNGTLPALRHLLETFDAQKGIGASGLDFFPADGFARPEDRRDYVILKSVLEAIQALESPTYFPAFGGSIDQSTWRWGKLHRIVFAHPLGSPFSVPPGNGAFPAAACGPDRHSALGRRGDGGRREPPGPRDRP